MQDFILPIIAAAVSGGAVSAFVVGLFNQSKTAAQTKGIDADTEIKLSGVALEFVAKLRAELEGQYSVHERAIKELSARVEHLEQEKSDLEIENDRLIGEMHACRIEIDRLREAAG